MKAKKIILAFDSFKGSMSAADCIQAATDAIIQAASQQNNQPQPELTSQQTSQLASHLKNQAASQQTSQLTPHLKNQATSQQTTQQTSQQTTQQTTQQQNQPTAQPHPQTLPLPLADGGEGTTQALSHYLDAKAVSCPAHDPLMRPILAQYAISSDGSTAIIETAAASGLTLLSPSERNPLVTTSFGSGEIILDAIRRGCRKIILGLGGSATNDAGMGLLSALGARFEGQDGNPLKPVGESLAKLAHADFAAVPAIDIMALCDVDNPLYGEKGAAQTYAAQKGADEKQIRLLDEGLRKFAQRCGGDPWQPGSGAAGGLGYGLRLVGAQLCSGSQAIIQASRLESMLQDADLVITGEGKIDSQTLCGKLPHAVMKCALSHGVPTVALAGKVENSEALLAAGFDEIVQISPPQMDPELAMQRQIAMANLAQAVLSICKRRNLC